MSKGMVIAVSALLFHSCTSETPYKGEIFDTHVHHYDAEEFETFSVTAGAISTSRDSTESYRKKAGKDFLFGLMFPCPGGLVPNGTAKCFPDGKDFPDTKWVESEIRNGRIHFIGELLNQYYGLSPADSIFFPYYELAEKYNLPVGVHLALAPPATPYGCCPEFRASLGNPLLLEDVLLRFPKLRIWVMHAGHPYQQEMIALMMVYPQVYVDISAIASFAIPEKAFEEYLTALIDAGFEDRIMFGSDSDIARSIGRTNGLTSLTLEQKEKIFHGNASRFFKRAAPTVAE